MRRAFQFAAFLLAAVLWFGPLAQAHASCRTLRSMGHCSNCPMPQPGPESNTLAENPCCQISAARTSPEVVWQPVASYSSAPPTLAASLLPLRPALLGDADHTSVPLVSSARALLCTFLI